MSPEPRKSSPQAAIEDELFRRRFSNWRVSLAGMTALVWLIALLYRYLDARSLTLWWAVIETLSLGLIAVLCLAYERRPSTNAGSPGAQRSWLYAWTLLSVLAGAVAGLLPAFLPAERIELQFSGAAVVSVLMMVFVITRSYRVLIFATVGAYTLMLCLSLALHAGMPWAVPVCLLFTATLLGMGLMLNRTLLHAIREELYAHRLLAELRLSHQRELRIQQRESMLNERQRMLSDLHDGMGAQLLTSLRLLESGRTDTTGAATALRECIDDLRLTVDAHEPAARNLTTLLGMLRYRLQPRIQAAGIQLAWRIGELPENATLPAQQSLDLLRILQQAIANVLQHAEARSIVIATRQQPRQLEISVEDDGRGLDPAGIGSGGRGLASMQRRAARLGAQLLIEPLEPTGTALRLRLDLPLGRRAAAMAPGEEP